MVKPKRSIIPFFIPNAGCKHCCVFCDQSIISGKNVPVTPEEILTACNNRLGSKVEESGVRPLEIAFYGGSFTALPVYMQNELLQAARQILDINLQNSIRISTRPDCIDEPTVERLKRFGVATVELGAQSMCDDVLLRSQRGHTSNDVAKAAKIIKRAGLALILQMMTGLPGDTREKALYTAERLIALQPDGVRIYPTVIIRGTRLYHMWKSGQYSEHSIGEAVGLCAELLVLFEKADVPVIRIGLNPSDDLSAGDAVAGAYHPAFGELAYSRMYYNKAVCLFERAGPDAPLSDIAITVAKGHVSKMTGQHGCNIRDLTEKYSLGVVKIVEADIIPGEIRIEKIPERVYNS